MGINSKNNGLFIFVFSIINIHGSKIIMEGEFLEPGVIVVQNNDPDDQILLQDSSANQFIGGSNGQVILNTEGQEVFMFDEESGEYQRYVIQDNPDEEHVPEEDVIEPSIELNDVEGGGEEDETTKYSLLNSSEDNEETFFVLPPKGEKQKQVILNQSGMN